MKSLTEFILESKIALPYNFDIYNEGPKNVDFKITKKNISSSYFKLVDWRKETDSNGKVSSKIYGKDYDQFIKLPLPADAITYKKVPTASSTNNWTKIPEIADSMYAGAWYSDKFIEYNYHQYNNDWDEWLRYIKPFMKGKISATLKESANDPYVLEIVINNDKFNEEREAKIKELQDPELLKQWPEEADREEKAKIEKRRQEEEERARKKKAWNDWWNSLSDGEKIEYEMGYSRKGAYTGD